MQRLAQTLVLTAFAVVPAAADPASILAANKAATAGAAWSGIETVVDEIYDYSGQGLTGVVHSQADLEHGWWMDDYALGPAKGANGFDGEHAWEKDPSGTVTVQDGGEQHALAVNEGYRRANLWWHQGFGGAKIVEDGRKSLSGRSFDVLTVTPAGGKGFEAWFDAQTHLLARIVEQQGPKTITTTLADYAPVGGVAFPRTTIVNNGDAKYDQTLTLKQTAFAHAARQTKYGAPKVTIADFTIAGAAAETSFPFQLINNHIFADAMVNGKGPFQFIFDTGGVNLLTPKLAGTLGLKSEGQMEGNGAGSGHMDVALTKVASLQLGAATVKNQVFAVVPLDALSPAEGVGLPGMVGFETFRRFVTRFDYGAGTITLIRPDAFDAKDQGAAIPFKFNGNTIEIEGSYNGTHGNFTIDTGSRSSLTVSAPFAAAHDLYRGATEAEAVTGWGVGGPTRSRVLRGGTLALGPESVRGPVVEVSTDKAGAMADPSIAGNIGAGILKRYVVTLDYDHATLYLKPSAKPVADLDTFDRSGMWINQGDRGFAVIDVTKGAPAEKAGIKAGDMILAVDGTPANQLKLYELRKTLRNEAPGTAMTFAVERKGRRKDIRIVLRDLI